MFAYASILYASEPGGPSPLMLALVVFLAMIGSCVVSGMSGALVPLGLKTVRGRSCYGLQYFLNHRHRCGEYGVLSQPSHRAGSLELLGQWLRAVSRFAPRLVNGEGKNLWESIN